jgi:hypothetical protein
MIVIEGRVDLPHGMTDKFRIGVVSIGPSVGVEIPDARRIQQFLDFCA